MLKLLLDEHISPDVAQGLRRRNRSMSVHSMAEWEDGSFLGQPDAACLQAAATQALTLVTYDRRTISRPGRRKGATMRALSSSTKRPYPRQTSEGWFGHWRGWPKKL